MLLSFAYLPFFAVFASSSLAGAVASAKRTSSYWFREPEAVARVTPHGPPADHARQADLDVHASLTCTTMVAW